MRTLVLVLALLSVAFGLAPLLRGTKDVILGHYIVVFHENVTTEQLAIDLARINSVHDVEYTNTYSITIKGFGAALNDRQLAAIRTNPRVAFVEEDQVMRIAGIEQGCATQSGADWGLNRISQRALDLDGFHHYPSTAGTGVTAYIIDTGVYTAHNDFQGRAAFGYKSDPSWSNNDGNGHGTHVGSTVGGNAYGVAKSVTLIAVKVLSDAGSGTTNGVIAGVEWATGDHLAKRNNAVGNMSLGGGLSTALNNACNAASRAGLHMVVAAGNSNNNACNGSPSGAADVICTGATDIGISNDGTQIDVRSYFSSWGTCVKVFAPGSDILGAWIGSPSATRVISGTSMASPHVCGVAALIVSANPAISFTALRSQIQQTATPDVIDLDCGSSACNQSPNLLLWNTCGSQ